MLPLEKYLRGREDRVVGLALKQVREQNRELEQKLRVLKEFKRKNPKTRKDIERLMQGVLCYGSLSFCCGPSKYCPFRDSVLKVLGLTQEDYKEYKSTCHESLLVNFF